MLFIKLEFIIAIQFLGVILIGITIHEFAHAFVAVKLGDKTPQKAGRLTLNPVNHIDPIGFIFLIIIGIGWAKPVEINLNNIDNTKKGDILISLAGPLSNFILSILGIVLLKLFSHTMFNTFLLLNVIVNLMLFVINILPFPPLDGFNIFIKNITIPNKLEEKFYGIFENLSYSLLIILLVQEFTYLEIIPFTALLDYLFEFLYKFISTIL